MNDNDFLGIIMIVVAAIFGMVFPSAAKWILVGLASILVLGEISNFLGKNEKKTL